MQFGEGIINSKSKTFLAFCFCFISAVGIFSGLEFPKYWQYRLFILGLVVGVFLILFWQKFWWRFGLACALFFILGGLRFMLSVPENSPANIVFYNGENKIVSGEIVGEPDARLDSVRYIVRTPPGKILVKLSLYPEYKSGDTLTVQCALQASKNFPDSNFRYDNYLARLGVWSVCGSPQVITVVPVARINFLYAFKAKVNSQVEKLWPEPQSSLMAGLLYGARGGFTPELLNDFSRVGVTHIIAISGYNISVVAAVLLIVLIRCGLYRHQAFYVCVGGIILFVLFTGASASVVRAGIMGIVVLIAQQLGRLSRIGNVVALTAAVMLLINPYVLVWDAGFQLSFLATLGLVYLSPTIEKRLAHIVKAPTIRAVLATTLSAIVATLPLILYQFGRLSLVAPVVNVLVLWLIPYLMLFGFMAVIMSWMVWPLGQVLAWITGLGLNYVIILTQWLGAKSWAALELSVPLMAMFLMYAGLIYLVAKKYVRKN